MKESEEIKQALLKFRNERDWEQFHNPKDLALAISIESAELLELFLWKKAEDANTEKVKEELADIFSFAFLLAEKYQFNVKEIVLEKIKKNAENGRVLIVYGGRDCDGSQSDGYTKLVDAGYYSAQKFINSLYEGADGAVWYEFAKPSEDADIVVETRDLALEAFENGHNSTIYA